MFSWRAKKQLFYLAVFAILMTTPVYATLTVMTDHLFVDPNPCVVGTNGLCTVNVAWRGGSGKIVQVWVSKDDGTPALFMCTNGNGTSQAPWISKGSIAEFIAYAATSCNSAGRSSKILSRVSVTGISKAITMPASGIGANAPSLVTNYLGQSSYATGQSAEMTLQKRISKKMIADAADFGIPYLRVMMMGYRPIYHGDSKNDLTLWQNSSSQYWALIDEMMNDLDARNVQIVPVFLWQTNQMAALVGETLTDTVTNQRSKSYLLLRQYVSEFINRYKNRKTIKFYELTNELDQAVDLDLVARCASNCNAMGNITTADMIGFTTRFASYIRTLDSTRAISLGGAGPRLYAEHLRESPEWTGASWQYDNLPEYTNRLREVDQGIDINSRHNYVNAGFDLNTTYDILKNAGKKLYVGEFGDTSGDPNRSLVSSVLNSIASKRIPYSSPWVFEFYSSTGAYDNHNIEPGDPYSEYLISNIQNVNKTKFGIGVPAQASPDTVPPRVIILSPTTGTDIASSVTVSVLASDNTYISKVQLILDGVSLGVVSHPAATNPPTHSGHLPFQFTLDSAKVNPNGSILIARAFDAAGNKTDDQITIK